MRRVIRRKAPEARGHLDAPPGATLEQRGYHFEGWGLLGATAAERVEVVFNGSVAIPARTGLDRPDVPANLPLAGVDRACGWAVTVDLAPFPTGDLHVSVALVTGTERRVVAEHTFALVPEGTSSRTGPPTSAPVWPWGLPDDMARTATPVSEEISGAERMPAADRAIYMSVGRSALKAIRLAQLAAGKEDFRSILDMPSGHGRVMRWLKAAYPNARLTASDLIVDGVDYCAATFGATPVYSTPFPAAASFSDSYDLIFVGSLLTHVDVHQWDHLIELWHSLLAPDGLLVATVHGELVAERMRAGHLYGYGAADVTRTLRAYEHSGFSFLGEPPDNIDYGITIAKPDWVLSRLLRHRDLRVVMYGEALWDHHQDVVAVVKRPLNR